MIQSLVPVHQSLTSYCAKNISDGKYLGMGMKFFLVFHTLLVEKTNNIIHISNVLVVRTAISEKYVNWKVSQAQFQQCRIAIGDSHSPQLRNFHVFFVQVPTTVYVLWIHTIKLVQFTLPLAELNDNVDQFDVCYNNHHLTSASQLLNFLQWSQKCIL